MPKKRRRWPWSRDEPQPAPVKNDAASLRAALLILPAAFIRLSY